MIVPLLGLYRAQFRTSLATQIQYRVGVMIWQISTVLQPTIYLVVWTTIARSSHGAVGGYDVAGFAAYFIVMMLVDHATFTWIMWEWEYRIRQGTLSPKLLRPVHPIHNDLADNLAHKLLGMVVILPATVVLILTFHPALHPSPRDVVAFIPALVLAFALRFTLEWTLAMAAFWTTRVSAANQVYYVTLIFLSGQVAPLSLFPEPVPTLATVLPFRWMVAFPTELLLGRLSWHETLIGLAVQAGWLLAGVLLLRTIWQRGVRRYSAVGA